MTVTRRHFLQRSASVAGFTVFSLCGLLTPEQIRAAWRQQNFSEGNLDHSLKRLFADRELVPSKKLKIRAPKTAENGANVPLTITSSLDNISKVYILIEKNPVPLAAEFSLSPALDVYIKARVKMAESCDILIVAESDDQLFFNRKTVNVTIGGCGG